MSFKHLPKPACRIAACSTALSLAFTLLIGMGAAQADDIDIYRTASPAAAQAPITALALDLPLGATAIVCDNPLTTPPSPDCLKLAKVATVSDILALAHDPTATLTGLLTGTSPNTLVSDLSAAAMAALDSTLTTLGHPIPPSNIQTYYFLAVKRILENLVNSRVMILLSHANRGPANAPAGYLPCAFADASSTSDATTPRQNTVACSNGAYVFIGLHNLANPLELQDIINRLADALVQKPDTSTTPPTFRSPTLGVGPGADSPFQAKEIYLELAKYLRGDPIYNGHLGYFDYGDTDPVTNLDSSLPVLSWDPTAETSTHRSYNAVLDAFPGACNINLISMQVRDSSAQDESDSEIPTLYPTADRNGDGVLTLPELVTSAEADGFKYGVSDARIVHSFFVVNDTLSDANALTNAGVNINTYTDLLGLIGRGQSIASATSPTLVVDASVGSAGVSTSRQAKTGFDAAAFLPIFRPLASNQPNWPGNIKKLKFVKKVLGQPALELRDQGNQPAIGEDGKIISSALTFWTDRTKLGAGVTSDGYIADLGGAGQNVPGFKFGGGGVPGQSNPSSASDAVRKLFYDSYPSGTSPLLNVLHPNTASVRSDVTTAVGAAAYSGVVASCSTNDPALYMSCLTTCNAGPTCSGILGAAACALSCPTTCSSCAYTRTADTVTKELLLYARGYDVGTQAAPKGSGARTDPSTAGIFSRPWLLGAVFHSRPVAINYGKRNGKSTDDTRLVYGSAEGFLHMVNASVDADGNDIGKGVESWAFMPQAVMGTLKLQRENAIGSALNYGVDGAATVIIRDRKGSSTSKSSADFIIDRSTSSDNDRVYIYFGLRRAGKNYYAIDATDPDNPTLLWSIAPDGLRRSGTNDVVSGTGLTFASLALTFSTPQVGTMMLAKPKAGGGTETRAAPVLIFGGGYNGGAGGIGKDASTIPGGVDPALGLDDFSGSVNKGNALFIVDAETGDLVWKAERTAAANASYSSSTKTFSHPLLADSFASEVTVLDTDSDGITDRIYVGDTGGRMWRGDFAGTDQSKWSLVHIADIGRHKTNDVANDRRFFHAPDFVPIRNGRNAYDVVLFGTGDREHPLSKVATNWVYAYRDTDIVSGKSTSKISDSASGTSTSLGVQTNFDDHTALCSTVGGTNCQDIALVGSTVAGWKIQLTRAGEKMTSAPLTQSGITNFTTYVPFDGAICTPQAGSGYLYSISARTGAAKAFVNQVSTARYSQQPTSGLSGEIVAGAGNNATAGNKVFQLPGQRSFRAGWAERVADDEKPVPQP